MKRTNQLDSVVDAIARKQLKAVTFRSWVIFRNAKKFRRDVRIVERRIIMNLNRLSNFAPNIELDVYKIKPSMNGNSKQ